MTYRLQPSGGVKHTKRNTPDDKVRHSAAQRDTRECPQSKDACTPVHHDPGESTSQSLSHNDAQTGMSRKSRVSNKSHEWLDCIDATKHRFISVIFESFK